MKKRIFLILFLLMIFLILPNGSFVSSALDETENDSSSSSSEETLQELTDTIDDQLGSVDFSALQEILDNLTENSLKVFGSSSFWDKITQMLDGDFGNGYNSFFQAVIGTFFEEIVNFIPLLASVVMITLICSMIGNLRSKESENVGQVVDFVCFGVVVVIVSSVLVGLLFQAKDLISSMQTQMNALFPILLTFLASVGAGVSVGIFQPAVAILSTVIVQVFVSIVIPLFVFQFVFIVVNNFSPSIKLNKFISLISSIQKWIAGICFSVFLAVLASMGIVAGSFDSASIRATKFAIKSYVPVLGGYISDGFNIVMASSVLIKNVVGVAGVFLLFATILTPVITIIACTLLLKLTSAILEPITNNSRVPEFLMQISKLLNLLVMMILGVAFMYVITIGLILCTANIF